VGSEFALAPRIAEPLTVGRLSKFLEFDSFVAWQNLFGNSIDLFFLHLHVGIRPTGRRRKALVMVFPNGGVTYGIAPVDEPLLPWLVESFESGWCVRQRKRPIVRAVEGVRQAVVRDVSPDAPIRALPVPEPE